MPSKTLHFTSDPAILPSPAYLDANCLISWYFGHRWHRPAKRLLFAFIRRKASLYVSTLAFDEAWWRLLVEFYDRDHGAGSWRPHLVRQEPSLLRRYEPELRRFSTAFLALPRLHIADQANARALVTSALDHVRDYALAPRDAFHLAILQSLGLSAIVTNDAQFQQIDAPWLTVVTF